MKFWILFFNKIIYEAGITSIQCRKDENDNYCSDASGNSADEKLMNVIDDATKSDYCTTIAIENLNWMAHDNKIVGHSNPAIAVVAKRGLKYLKKFSQCQDEVAEIEACFKGDNIDNLCSKYNSSECQTAIADPFKVATSCQSLSEETKNQILRDLYNKVVFKAGIAFIQCQKDEYDNYCSEAFEYFIDEKLMDVIDDVTNSEYCTTVAIESLNWMVHDNKIAGLSNPAVSVVAKRGLEYLKKFSQCLDEVAEIESCFHGDDVNQLCSKYKSSKCQTAISNPFEVATSCQSFSDITKDQIISDYFNRIILKDGITSIKCQKDENNNYCSESVDFMTAVSDSCKSKQCTENVLMKLDHMVFDDNIKNSNEDIKDILIDALDVLNSESCNNEVIIEEETSGIIEDDGDSIENETESLAFMF